MGRLLHSGLPGQGSALARLDPRARLAAVALALIAVASIPAGDWSKLCAHTFLVLALVALAGGAWIPLRRALLGGAPLVLAVTAGLWFAAVADPARLALSIGWRALLSLTLLAVLSASTTLPDLIRASRWFGLPRALGLNAMLMLRYVGLLEETWSRMSRAREARTTGPPHYSRLHLMGGQVGVLFVRSWDRAEAIHAAMLSRGFSGDLPTLTVWRFRAADAVLAGAAALLFGAARWLA